MTFVLVVWFWVGNVQTAPTMISVPGFTSKEKCEFARKSVVEGLNANTPNYNKNLFAVCLEQ